MTSNEQIRDCIRRMAIGPRASKNLGRAETCVAMQSILDGVIPEATAAVFLMGLRLKRETLEENLGVLDALRSRSRCWDTDLEKVYDLADPYDGFLRVPHYTVFVAALLGAMGLPTVVHGALRIPPKSGVTHRQLLEALGLKGLAFHGEALGHHLAEHGWIYVDLEEMCPGLAALTSLREDMVKRTCLSTVEKLVIPVRGKWTGIATGFVHSAYEETLMGLLRESEVQGIRVIRGPEGHTTLPLGRDVAVCGCDEPTKEKRSFELPPRDDDGDDAVPPIEASQLAAIGIQALESGEGPAARQIARCASSHLVWSGLEDSYDNAESRVWSALRAGEGAERLNAGIRHLNQRGT